MTVDNVVPLWTHLACPECGCLVIDGGLCEFDLVLKAVDGLREDIDEVS